MNELNNSLSASQKRFLSVNLLIEKTQKNSVTGEEEPVTIIKLAESTRHQTSAMAVHPYYKEL